MNTQSSRRPHNEDAFTLIEMLVVIAIIGILASLLLPALSVANMKAKMKVAQTEEVSLIAAISQYKSEYSIMPASTNAVFAAQNAPKVNNDFTFGSVVFGVPGLPPANLISTLSQQIITPQTTGDYQNANSEIVSILRDDTNWPEANGTSFHIYNPQKTSFFNPSKISTGTGSAGVDPNSILRDPWGNPYMVTLDMNGDGKCYDKTWYTLAGSQTFGVPGDAMVWSLGPKWQIFNPTLPATASVNQTIVCSWK